MTHKRILTHHGTLPCGYPYYSLHACGSLSSILLLMSCPYSISLLCLYHWPATTCHYIRMPIIKRLLLIFLSLSKWVICNLHCSPRAARVCSWRSASHHLFIEVYINVYCVLITECTNSHIFSSMYQLEII